MSPELLGPERLARGGLEPKIMLPAKLRTQMARVCSTSRLSSPGLLHFHLLRASRTIIGRLVVPFNQTRADAEVHGVRRECRGPDQTGVAGVAWLGTGFSPFQKTLKMIYEIIVKSIVKPGLEAEFERGVVQA